MKDQLNPDYSGTFIDWMIKFWGEKINTTSTTTSTTAASTSSATVPAVVTTTVTSVVSATTSTSATPSSATPTSVNSTIPDTGIIDGIIDLPVKNVWVLVGIGMSIAFILVGCVYCACFIRRRCSRSGKGQFKKIFGGDDYELVSPSGDTANGAEDSIPLASKESFNAFGDTSEDEDENTRVVFENAYMDEYMNEKDDNQNNSEVVEQNQGGGSSNASSSEQRRHADNN